MPRMKEKKERRIAKESRGFWNRWQQWLGYKKVHRQVKDRLFRFFFRCHNVLYFIMDREMRQKSRF